MFRLKTALKSLAKKGKTLLLIIAYAVFYMNCYSQDLCMPEYSKKSEEYLIIADSLQQIGSLKALGFYKKAINEDTLNIDARCQLAKIYFNKLIASKYDILLSPYYDFYAHKAEDYLLKSIEQCKSFNDYNSFYYLGSLYFYKNEYNLAGYFLKEYLHNSTNREYNYIQAHKQYKKYLQWKNWNNYPSPVTPRPVLNLNTNEDEYTPHISHDGQIMFYTRRYTKPIKNTLFSEIVTDAFYSYVIGIDSLNNWIYSKGNIAFELEGKTIESFSLSSDKNTVYLTVCNNVRLENKIIKDCDIYTSNYNQNEWDDPVPLQANVNKKNTFEGYPCIAANDDTLYFSSNSFNSLGGKDIFFSTKDNNNHWSNPVNMGTDINTINDEITPFLSYDNKTMYFSSNGHFGLGGFDIFHTTKNNSTWSKPINIGKPYNNKNDNLFFVTDARGLSAYYAGKDDFTFGGSDILSVSINSYFRPKPKMIINIKVNVPDDLYDFEPSISIHDIFNDRNIPLVRSNNQNYYSAIVDIDESTFLLSINNRNCVYTNKIIQTNSKYAIFESLDIVPIKTGIKFILEDLLVNRNSSGFSNNERIILNDFSNYIRKNNIRIKIISYYYSITKGEEDKNKAMSLVKMIKDELIRNGVGLKQLNTETIDLYILKTNKKGGKAEIKKEPEVQFEMIEK